MFTFLILLQLAFVVAVCPDGKISYWEFEEVSGTVAVDSCDENDGDIVGATIDQAGQVGKAYSFDGVNDYVDCDTNVNLNITGDLTISTWVLPNDVDKYQMVAGKWKDTEGSNLRQYALSIMNTDKPRFYIGSGSSFDRVESSVAIDNTCWRHLVGVYNGTHLKIYVDGIERGSKETTQIITNQDIDFYIGRNYWAGSNAAYFDGLIDEVSVYNIALSDSEIQALYDSGDIDDPVCELPQQGGAVPEISNVLGLVVAILALTVTVIALLRKK